MAIVDSEGWDYFPSGGNQWSTDLARVYGALGYYGWFSSGDTQGVPVVASTDAPYGYGQYMRIAYLGYINKLLPAPMTKGYFAQHLRNAAGNGSDRGFSLGLFSAANGRMLFRLLFTGTGIIRVITIDYSRSGSPETVIASSAPGSFPEYLWFHMEFGYDIEQDELEVRINTIPVISLKDAGANSTPPCASFDVATFSPNGQAGGDIDNWVVNDSEWNGVVRVQWLPTFGIGDTTQWSSYSLAVPNWQAVQNRSLNDSSFVFNHTEDVGNYDLYTVTPLVDSSEVLSVAVKGAYRQNDATQHFVRNVMKSGSTLVEGTIKPSNTQYKFNVDRYNVDPNTGNAWLYTAVNALQIGPKQED